MNRKRWLSLFLLLLPLSVGGCGRDEALDAYKEEMNRFYEAVQENSDAIGAIDTTSDTAIEELLGYLDKMESEFTALGDLEVPKQFSAIEPLADDAASYMQEANQLYHEAFAEGYYDDVSGEAARQNYERAMKRVSYIADIFQGDVPDDENVTVIVEDEDGSVLPDDTPQDETPQE